MAKPSEKALKSFLANETGLARIGTYSQLAEKLKKNGKYGEGGLAVPSYTMNLIIDEDIAANAFVEVDTLPATGESGLLYVIKNGGGVYYYENGSWREIASSSAEPKTTHEIKTTTIIGGYTSPTTIPAGTNLEDIIEKILTTVTNPTLTNPSATISGTGSKLLEKGATQNATITISFNRGSINPAYGTSGYRSGEATGYELNGSAQSSGTINVTVSETNNTFAGKVSYAQGEQPKNSAGQDFNSPLPAGTINTNNTVEYEFVNAAYATTADINTMTKQPLFSYKTKSHVFNMTGVRQTDTIPMMFDVPKELTITAVKVWNPLTGQWVVPANPYEFRTEDTTHQDAAGRTVNYTRYIDNRGYGAGGREVKIEWS